MLRRQHLQDEVRPRGHCDPGDDEHVVAQRGVGDLEPFVFSHGRVEIVAPLRVGAVDLGDGGVRKTRRW